MATPITTPRAGLPQWKAEDKVKFITDVSKAFADVDKSFALAGDAFIPCTATYDSATKRHTLAPIQANITLPEVFTVRFIATASFTKEDKIYIGGKEYTPAYTDGTQAVQTGAWVLDTAVGITCVKTVAKAFVGAGSISQFALKANAADVYTKTAADSKLATKANCYNKIFNSGDIVDIILEHPCGSFRVDAGVTGMPQNAFWIVTTFTGLGGYLYATAVILDNPKTYTATYNAGKITNKFSGWKETPIIESGKWVPTLRGITIAGNPIYTSNGNYYKIGNIIFAHARITITSIGGMDGISTIIGSLPYSVKTKLASGVNYMDVPPDSTTYSNSTNIALTNIYVFAKMKDGTDFDVSAIYERG